MTEACKFERDIDDGGGWRRFRLCTLVQEHVTASGATSEIYHSTLVSLYERLQAIQQQAAPINDRLKSFKNLPSVCERDAT